MEMITEMMKDTKEIKNEQREYREEFNIIKDQINNYKQVIGKLKTENEELKREMKKMQESIVKIEKKEIQNNIIINGIAVERENPNQLKEKIETKLEAYLGIKSKIKEVTKISKTMCKVELENYSDKREILKNKKKLRRVKEGKIYINEDLTYDDRRIQKEIRKIAKQEREKGRIVKERLHKLIINNEVWYWNETEAKLVLQSKAENQTAQSKN